MGQNRYAVRGRTAATVATAGHAIAGVWNPHSTKRIEMYELMLFKTAVGTAADAIQLQRATARGTAGSTVTPVIANDENRDIAPVSGFLLDLAAYSVQPTLESPGFKPWVAPAVAGAGIVLPIPEGIVIPPGAGLIVVQVAATIWPVSDIGVSVNG